MTILHYTQHVLGIGHLFRSLAIDAALAPDTVHLVTGGPEIPLQLPPNTVHHAMPPLKMDSEFHSVQAVDAEADLENTWRERERLLLHLYESLQPDVVLLEMFPFGRKRFAREILPVLQANRSSRRPAITLCSVRDILVEKEDQDKFEGKVLNWLNAFFDGVLVHSDPALIRLDATFARVADIACPVWYTGYVAQGPTVSTRAAARRELGLQNDMPMILASAGSGTVGQELLLATLEASALLHPEYAHALVMFTGPHAGPELHERLRRLEAASTHVSINTFTNRFPDYVLASDLSVSMAGYNTTMNVLACGARGLLFPFEQNREQGMRLNALVRAGYLEILRTADLKPERLASRMKEAIIASAPPRAALRLQGDTETASIIRALANAGGRA